MAGEVPAGAVGSLTALVRAVKAAHLCLLGVRMWEADSDRRVAGTFGHGAVSGVQLDVHRVGLHRMVNIP